MLPDLLWENLAIQTSYFTLKDLTFSFKTSNQKDLKY